MVLLLALWSHTANCVLVEERVAAHWINSGAYHLITSHWDLLFDSVITWCTKDALTWLTFVASKKAQDLLWLMLRVSFVILLYLVCTELQDWHEAVAVLLSLTLILLFQNELLIWLPNCLNRPISWFLSLCSGVLSTGKTFCQDFVSIEVLELSRAIGWSFVRVCDLSKLLLGRSRGPQLRSL